MKYKPLVYSVLAGLYLSGCKPNENKPPDKYSPIEKIISTSNPIQEQKKDISDVIKKDEISESPYKKPSSKINKKGTVFKAVYTETPETKISGFYTIYDDVMSIKIEKKYEWEKSEVIIMKPRTSKAIEKISIHYMGKDEENLGNLSLVRDLNKGQWSYGSGVIVELNEKQVCDIFSKAESNWDVFFRQLEADVVAAMPYMKHINGQLKVIAEQKLNIALQALEH
ncbi:hypothetical protein HYX16_04725 [Candidatus Woesearchaeota archaeon]|nr:hypothetical protein [Candidatus Woesearchaeota archaeon]